MDRRVYRVRLKEGNANPDMPRINLEMDQNEVKEEDCKYLEVPQSPKAVSTHT